MGPISRPVGTPAQVASIIRSQTVRLQTRPTSYESAAAHILFTLDAERIDASDGQFNVHTIG